MENPNNGARPKSLILLTGPVAEVESQINLLSDDYAIMNGITFNVMKELYDYRGTIAKREIVVASCAMVSKSELRKAQLASRG